MPENGIGRLSGRHSIGDRFVAGVVFHTGPRRYRLGEGIDALPICALWG